MPPIYPDADLANADWPKTTWDGDADLATYLARPIDELRTLVKLPAWDAAPDDIRTAVEDLLALTPD